LKRCIFGVACGAQKEIDASDDLCVEHILGMHEIRGEQLVLRCEEGRIEREERQNLIAPDGETLSRGVDGLRCERSLEVSMSRAQEMQCHFCIRQFERGVIGGKGNRSQATQCFNARLERWRAQRGRLDVREKRASQCEETACGVSMQRLQHCSVSPRGVTGQGSKMLCECQRFGGETCRDAFLQQCRGIEQRCEAPRALALQLQCSLARTDGARGGGAEACERALERGNGFLQQRCCARRELLGACVDGERGGMHGEQRGKMAMEQAGELGIEGRVRRGEQGGLREERAERQCGQGGEIGGGRGAGRGVGQEEMQESIGTAAAAAAATRGRGRGRRKRGHASCAMR
jgi:hypothetical protein